MYKVTFNGVIFYTSDNEDQAIGLALNLHKSSNVNHHVQVHKDDNLIVHLYVEDKVI